MRNHISSLASVASALALVVLVSACDSSGSGGADGKVRVSGVVTDGTASKSDQLAAKAGESFSDVDDAAVSGSEVDDNGTVKPSNGETRSNEQGEYVLESDASSDFMLVTAVKGDVTTRVLVDARVSGTVRAASMTHETSAEADVFIESRRQGDETVTSADVAAFVTTDVAADIRTGVETAARVAVAIGNAEQARQTYATEHGSTNDDQTRREEEEAYREWQASLSGHVSASATASANARLESRTASSLTAGGTQARIQAQANETARAALIAFTANLGSRTRFALRRQAEISAALAASSSIESDLRATSSARADAAAAAGVRLRAALASASGEAAMTQAWSSFRSDIHGLVAAQLGIPIVTVSAAVTALATVEATLALALQSSTTVDAIVDAKADFYSQAESRLKTSFAANAQADLGARILAVVEAR